MSEIEVAQKVNPFTKNLHLPVFVDADLIVYRTAFSKEVTSKATAKEKIEDIVSFIKNHTSSFDMGQYTFYLTGKGNFRNDVAVTAEYKANRKGKDRPEFLDFSRDYLRLAYDAIVTEGQECDDAIGIAAAATGYNCIAASIDKDFLQIPCWHYNFRRNEWYKPTEWEGTKFFYTQILTGDAVDNIIGLYGIGPKKAAKLLEECTTELELYNACVFAYNGDTDRVLENARLLWLRRYEGQLWGAPE